MSRISISILSCNFLKLQDEIEKINKCKMVSGIHLDIMDGVYVNNISFGFPVIQEIHKISELPMSAHLMIHDPKKYISTLAEYKISEIFIHINHTTDYLVETIECIKNFGIKAGLVLNPDECICDNSDIKKIIQLCNSCLVMTVVPGFGGQKFILKSLDKIAAIRSFAPTIQISIDGGITLDHVRNINEVDGFVIGSYFFQNTEQFLEVDSYLPRSIESPTLTNVVK